MIRHPNKYTHIQHTWPEMSGFTCRSHDKTFLSMAALGNHIEKHHSSEGKIECSYKDSKDMKTKLRHAAQRRMENNKQFNDFVGVGLEPFQPIAPASTGKRSIQEKLFLTAHEIAFDTPRIIVEAVRGMKHRLVKALYPDVHARYAHVMSGIQGSSKVKNGARLKRAVFSLMLPN